MAQITAKDVADLRAKTGLGMMDCKKALVEAEGDVEKAIKILREKGLATAAKKESRIASEGLVDIMTKGDVTAMVEVNSETDFVAKNSTFKAFVSDILSTIIETKPANLEALLEGKFNGTEQSVQEALVEKIALIGEKLSIRRFVIVEGTVATYVHGMGSTGVIVKVEADEAAKSNADFNETVKNVALQIAAGSPPAYVAKEDVPANVIEEEKTVLINQAKNDPKNAGKPEQVLEKMVMGRLGKFYSANCLLEQEYVKDDSLTVGKYVQQAAKAFGGSIKIVSFVIFEKGEGIEKREEDFAAEIAKMVNKD